ncbi:MAG: transcriptional repressor NrdR [Ruminococcaceae bacterium]|nr:transcriptional repressor NrdR [Oscillospiraceae bacterium]
MKCPSCGHSESKVIDSRPVEEGNSIRRRRECLACQKRFNTFEIIESVQIIVVKKNGEKELFDRTKLLGGILKATQKRPVNAEEIVNDIESELYSAMKNEVTTTEIGEMVMDRLKVADQVAYVRFASVYREFTDVNNFIDELMELKNYPENK